MNAPLRYLSVCSGIEAASVAWEPLGFEPVAFAEIDKAAMPSQVAVATSWAVRRLMPVECERLQGFPDGHTAGQADGPRYRQLGNSKAVPVVRWIGARLAAADGAPQPIPESRGVNQ